MEHELLLAKANEEVKKVADYIKEHEDMFGMMDLKVHDVDFYIWKNMENDFPLTYEEEDNYSGYNIFSRFCEFEYDIFIQWCVDKGINFSKMRHDVGRTSKFYLHGWNDRDIDLILYNIINDIAKWWLSDYFNLSNGVVSVDEDMDIEDCIESLEYLANDFYNDFMKEISDMVEVYDYIKDFKDNQVEYFKDFCEEEEDRLSYEKEQEEKKEKRSHDLCLDIKNKYGISDNDMNILKENIHCF